MDDRSTATLFAGDLGDPLVAEIAAALPPVSVRQSCPGDLPDEWPPSLRTLVLHRAHLTIADGVRLRRLRARGGPPVRVVLCVGPHVRHHQLVQWEGLVDVILTEGTASDVVARHVVDDEPPVRSPGVRQRVRVVSADYELRRLLSDTCRSAGFGVTATRDWTGAVTGGLALWDVPVLEADWSDALAHAARRFQVVGLFGFADRETVAHARAAGVSACLDVPCDVQDLVYVLDRLAAARPRGVEGPHRVPPAPTRFRVVRPGIADAAGDPAPSSMADPRP
jgi:hypothetical protein